MKVKSNFGTDEAGCAVILPIRRQVWVLAIAEAETLNTYFNIYTDMWRFIRA